jgi:cytochrome c oxidase subunit IV
MNNEESNVVVQPVDKAKIRHVVKVALILFVVTVIEFIIAFTLGSGGLRTSIFVVMTIVKAFYIVSEFMHLGHEEKGLRWMIIFPTILVIWLIIAALIEGSYIHMERIF